MRFSHSNLCRYVDLLSLSFLPQVLWKWTILEFKDLRNRKVSKPPTSLLHHNSTCMYDLTHLSFIASWCGALSRYLEPRACRRTGQILSYGANYCFSITQSHWDPPRRSSSWKEEEEEGAEGTARCWNSDWKSIVCLWCVAASSNSMGGGSVWCHTVLKNI